MVAFHPDAIRKDFPILSRTVHGESSDSEGKPLVYLDNAATTQKPKQVIDAIVDFYEKHNANVHRGIHLLSEEATGMYEEARKQIARFIGCQDEKEIVFVRNTTEAINLVAYSWGRQHIGKGDEILISEMEHHSNIVPWQMLAKEKGAIIKYMRVIDDGKLNLSDLKSKLSEKTKLVALVHMSNFLGTINPIQEVSKIIKKFQIATSPLDRLGTPRNDRAPLFLVDGAQAVAHMPVDVKKLGCDFYTFSGHKMYGPMGIGVLWARREILESMPPFLTGGGMIAEVRITGSTFAGLPDKFDAGTPNVEGAIGLAAAIEYLKKIGMEKVRKHEIELTRYVMKRLSPIVIPRTRSAGPWGSHEIATSKIFDSEIAQIRGTPRNDKLSIQIYGPKNAEDRGGIISFTFHLGGKEIHGHDIAQILDSEGIAVRSGHHCAMPMHLKLGLAGTTRISFGIYNTKEEIDRFIEAFRKIQDIFAG